MAGNTDIWDAGQLEARGSSYILSIQICLPIFALHTVTDELTNMDLS